MCGYWSELAPVQKSPQCHVNAPLDIIMFRKYTPIIHYIVPAQIVVHLLGTEHLLLHWSCLLLFVQGLVEFPLASLP